MTGLFRKNKICQSTGCEIKQSPLHGQGVFALKGFRKGDILETSPVILLPAAEKEFLECTSLFRYYFLVGSAETPVALGLGYSSLYNHSYKANALYTISLHDLTITIRASKPIFPGEEITLNYNGSPDDGSPVYFPEESRVSAGMDGTSVPDGRAIIRTEKELYVKETRNKGRGVFCKTRITRDDLIEVSPILVLPAEDHDTVHATRLADYFFHFNKEERTMALSLGFGSLYNHAKGSNAAYFLTKDNRTITYYAVEDIEAGQEICINYSGEPGNDFPEWFESRQLAICS